MTNLDWILLIGGVSQFLWVFLLIRSRREIRSLKELIGKGIENSSVRFNGVNDRIDYLERRLTAIDGKKV